VRARSSCDLTARSKNFATAINCSSGVGFIAVWINKNGVSRVLYYIITGGSSDGGRTSTHNVKFWRRASGETEYMDTFRRATVLKLNTDGEFSPTKMRIQNAFALPSSSKSCGLWKRSGNAFLDLKKIFVGTFCSFLYTVTSSNDNTQRIHWTSIISCS